MKIPKKPKRGDVYSVWKYAHHREKLEALKRGELIAPQHIQVDLNGKCNHNCDVCFYRNAGFTHMEFVPNEEIPVDVGVKIFDQMADLGIPATEITGGGEPLLYPGINACLDSISRNNIELGLVTNGRLLTKDILDRITNPKWIRFSMDSATPEVRMKTHGCKADDFEHTINNLRRVVDKFSGNKDVRIGVSFVVRPSNINDIVKAAALYREIGVDNIRYSFAFTTQLEKLLSKEQRTKVFSMLNEAKKLEDKNYDVFIMDKRMDDFSAVKKDFSFCGYQMFTFQIGCDSLVYPCCVEKYHKNFAFGDIRKESLKEIIFGEKRRKYIENFDVEKCLPCWIKNHNLFVEYLLSDNPPHVNFT